MKEERREGRKKGGGRLEIRKGGRKRRREGSMKGKEGGRNKE